MKLGKKIRDNGIKSLPYLILLLLTAITPLDFPILSDVRHLSFDTFQQYNHQKPESATLILDIDEESLRQYGQWPWSRDLMAEIVIRLYEGGAAVAGMDIVFAEDDRTSPPRVLKKIGIEDPQFDEYDYDKYFADVIAQVPLVLGYPFLMTSEIDSYDLAGSIRAGTVVSGGEDPSRFTYLAQNVTPNIPVLAEQATGTGFFNVIPDSDGKVRSVPLFLSYRDRIYPSLVMEMLRVAVGARSYIIRASETGITNVKVGNWEIPTDAMGRVSVNYRGTSMTFPYLSVINLMNGNFDPALLDGAMVLVGTSAAGLLDLRATPVSPVFPGVEIHANLLDTIVSGDFLVRPDWMGGAEMVYVLVAGLLTIVIAQRFRALWSGMALIFLSAAVLTLSFYLFQNQGLLINFVYVISATLLIFSFNTFLSYIREEQEKAYIRSAFGQYLSPVVVEQLANNPESLSLSGEEKHMSIMFSDIRGFTTISERLTPQELTSFLNEYMTPMTNIIMDRFGTVDKFLGDAIMAFWNAPLDDPNHADNALMASVDMLIELEELKKEWHARGLPEINIGIGLNSGLVRVGNMGSTQRFDYTVLGDNVNLAARLEGINKTYGCNIVISEYTLAILTGSYHIRFLDAVKVKGKHLPVKIYQVAPHAYPVDEIALYEAMLEHYNNLRWDDALAFAKQLRAKDPKSVLYELYEERIVLYQVTPPPADWDGSFTMTTK